MEIGDQEMLCIAIHVVRLEYDMYNFAGSLTLQDKHNSDMNRQYCGGGTTTGRDIAESTILVRRCSLFYVMPNSKAVALIFERCLYK